jgi:hypothetical protein
LEFVILLSASFGALGFGLLEEPEVLVMWAEWPLFRALSPNQEVKIEVLKLYHE